MSRKELILEAAAELFAEKGFEATSTAELARKASVAEGTIFHYFKTKDRILVHLFHELTDLYIENAQREADDAQDGLDGVLRIIRFHFQFIKEHSAKSLVLFRDFPSYFLKPEFPERKLLVESSAQIFEIISNCIRIGQEDGSIRHGRVNQLTFIIRGLLAGLSRQTLMKLMETPEVTEEAVEFCRLALARFP